MITNGLPIAQRRRVAALMRAQDGVFTDMIAAESDLDVLREVNYQLSRQPRKARASALADRLAALTGRRPASGMSGFQRWYGRKGEQVGRGESGQMREGAAA